MSANLEIKKTVDTGKAVTSTKRVPQARLRVSTKPRERRQDISDLDDFGSFPPT